MRQVIQRLNENQAGRYRPIKPDNGHDIDEKTGNTLLRLFDTYQDKVVIYSAFDRKVMAPRRDTETA